MHATETGTDKADSTAMDDQKRVDSAKSRRGKAIKRRRLNLGITSERAFADAMNESVEPGRTRIDKATIGRAENGEASDGTYDRIEAWLDRQELENGLGESQEPGAIKLTMHGVYGMGEVILEGPADRPDEMAEALEKILDRLQRRDPS